MRADAEAAAAGLAPGSPWWATALLLQGIADVLAGEADRADPILADAAEVATHIGALPAASAALAQRALVAIARHDWMEPRRSPSEPSRSPGSASSTITR